MTQPTAELLQAIKELAEKATPAPWQINGSHFYSEGKSEEAELLGQAYYPEDLHILILIRNNLPTIIAALELKERVEKAGGYMLVNGNPLMPQSGGVSASDRGPMR